jgi:hypothetical protein
LVNEYTEKISPHYYSNIYSKEHEIAWLSFLLWTRGGLHIQVYYSEIKNDIRLPLPQRSNAHIFYLVGEYPGIYQSQFSIDDRKYLTV